MEPRTYRAYVPMYGRMEKVEEIFIDSSTDKRSYRTDKCKPREVLNSAAIITESIGILDIKGTEVFTGDILEVTTHKDGNGDIPEDEKPRFLIEVQYLNPFQGYSIGIRLDRYSRGIDTLKVVGNIFLNKDLLKTKLFLG